MSITMTEGYCNNWGLYIPFDPEEITDVYYILIDQR
jgi:hypothetical protein